MTVREAWTAWVNDFKARFREEYRIATAARNQRGRVYAKKNEPMPTIIEVKAIPKPSISYRVYRVATDTWEESQPVDKVHVTKE